MDYLATVMVPSFFIHIFNGYIPLAYIPLQWMDIPHIFAFFTSVIIIWDYTNYETWIEILHLLPSHSLNGDDTYLIDVERQ